MSYWRDVRGDDVTGNKFVVLPFYLNIDEVSGHDLYKLIAVRLYCMCVFSG